MSDFIDGESVIETIETKIMERMSVGCGLYCTYVSYKNNRIKMLLFNCGLKSGLSLTWRKPWA